MSLSCQRCSRSLDWSSGGVSASSSVNRCVGEDNGDNESIETESLTENEDQDDSNEDILLGGSSDTSVTSHTDSETGSEGRETAAKARGEVLVTSVGIVRPGASSNIILRSAVN